MLELPIGLGVVTPDVIVTVVVTGKIDYNRTFLITNIPLILRANIQASDDNVNFTSEV